MKRNKTETETETLIYHFQLIITEKLSKLKKLNLNCLLESTCKFHDYVLTRAEQLEQAAPDEPAPPDPPVDIPVAVAGQVCSSSTLQCHSIRH